MSRKDLTPQTQEMEAHGDGFCVVAEPTRRNCPHVRQITGELFKSDAQGDSSSVQASLQQNNRPRVLLSDRGSVPVWGLYLGEDRYTSGNLMPNPRGRRSCAASIERSSHLTAQVWNRPLRDPSPTTFSNKSQPTLLSVPFFKFPLYTPDQIKQPAGGRNSESKGSDFGGSCQTRAGRI